MAFEGGDEENINAGFVSDLDLTAQAAVPAEIDIIIIYAGDFLIKLLDAARWIVLFKDAFAKTAQN